MHRDHVVNLPGHTPVRASQTLLVVGACAVFVACSRATVAHSADVRATPIEVADRPRGESSVIRQGEMRAKPFQTAYEAVLRLRPHYLAAGHMDIRSHTVTQAAAVIEKGMPESIDALKEILADAVLEIRFIEPQDAVTLFGPQYSGGIVIVRLANPRKTANSPIPEEECERPPD